MTRYDYVSPEHRQGIGSIILHWALLEGEVIKALQILTKAEMADTVIIFWHMSHKERINRLASLFYSRFGKASDPVRIEFDTLARRTEIAYAVRNIAAHSRWTKGTAQNTIKPFILNAKGADIKFSGRGIAHQEFTATKLGKEAEKIERLTSDFRDFFGSHFPIEK